MVKFSFRRAGIGGAFQHDQLPLVDVRSDGLDRPHDIAQIGFVVLIERSGHADNDRVHLGDLGVIRRRPEARLLRLPDGGGKDADDIGAAGVEGPYLVQGNIEARHPEALAAEQQRQRQADISHPHDPDAGLAGFDFVLEIGQPAGSGS